MSDDAKDQTRQCFHHSSTKLIRRAFIARDCLAVVEKTFASQTVQWVLELKYNNRVVRKECCIDWMKARISLQT